MHCTNVAALAAVASAAAIPTARLAAREAGYFQVAGFTAAHIGRSDQGSVSFNLYVGASGHAQTHCTGQATSTLNNGLASVSGKCEDSQLSFNFKNSIDSGVGSPTITLYTSLPDGTLVSGMYTFPKAYDVWVPYNGGTTEELRVPAGAFAVDGTSQSAAKPKFEVTSWYAHHIPHSLDAGVNFNISAPALDLALTSCSATVESASTNGLSDINQAPCANGDVKFTFHKLDTGKWQLDLLATTKEGTLVTGSYVFDPAYDVFVASPPGSGFTWEELTVPPTANFEFEALVGNP